MKGLLRQPQGARPEPLRVTPGMVPVHWLAFAHLEIEDRIMKTTFGPWAWLAALAFSMVASVVQAAPAALEPGPALGPDGWVSVTFVGYCDGMQLNNVDGEYIGFRTGCGEGLVGGDDLQSGLGLDAVLLIGMGADTRRYELSSDFTFQVYTMGGNLVSSGRWVYKAPTPGIRSGGASSDKN